MLPNSKLFISVFLIFIFLQVSCNTLKHDKLGVESAMKYYDHLIQKLDADSISQLYSADGNMGDIAIGRDSIRKFLSSFKHIQVLSQISKTKSIELSRDGAIQKGNYIQTDVLSEKDTIIVKGEYEVQWVWLGKQGWHIKRMTTKPIK